MRAWIRRQVPGSTTVYEESRLKWRARGTRKQVESLLQTQQPIRIDIGSGDLRRSGWVGIDITDGCDLFWDLRNGIPFPDNSVDFAYSSHVLEHMPYQAGQAVLGEVYRVLKPGGVVSISVPNAELYVRAYLKDEPLKPDHDFWEPALVSGSGIDLLNYVAYMGGEHACMFDQTSLVERLRSAGFVEATARHFDPAIDLPEREFESIYAEATKPDS